MKVSNGLSFITAMDLHQWMFFAPCKGMLALKRLSLYHTWPMDEDVIKLLVGENLP